MTEDESTYLRDEQYRDDCNLRRRQRLHERYAATDAVSWFRWLFDQFAPLVSATSSVLEVGGGTGALWVENADRLPGFARLCITDFSAGMLKVAERRVTEAGVRAHFEVADVRALPNESATIDVVIADHMLYHVPERTRALSEIARVLRPDGWLVAATNGQQSLRELDDVISRFLGSDAVLPSLPFSLENGTDQLREFFGAAEPRRCLPSHGLDVTDPEPVVEYIRSLPAGSRLNATNTNEIRGFVAQQIRTTGCFHINTEAGVFLAARPLSH
jgi:SAM-dependent methyltransferase